MSPLPKNIVKDVYTLLRQLAAGKPLPATQTKFAVLRFSSALYDSFERRLTQERRPRSVKDKVLRMSELGRPCTRALWYRMRPEIPSEPLHPWTMIKFMYGDMIEHLVLLLVTLSGHKVTDEQARCEVKLPNGWRVVGHIDARVDGVIQDVKSASTFSMKKFTTGDFGDDLFGYKGQLDGYTTGFGDKEAGWLAVDKQHGHLVHTPYTPTPLDIPKLTALTTALEDSHYEPIRPELALTTKIVGGNEALNTMCSYCEYKRHCWRSSNKDKGLRTYIYSKGPVYLTRVFKEPRVPELTEEKIHDS